MRPRTTRSLATTLRSEPRAVSTSTGTLNTMQDRHVLGLLESAWQAAGNELVKGPAATTISYVRKLVAGEIGIKEFEALVKEGAALVVDARTGEEYAKGHLPKALNIPAEEMARRFAEIPAGKTVIIHCSTGTRAEMAFDILKEKGIKARYLRASVAIGSDGRPVITE